MEITATDKDLIPGCVARWDVTEADKTYDFILMETGEDIEEWPHGTGCLYIREGKFRTAMCVNLSVALDADPELFAHKLSLFDKLKARTTQAVEKLRTTFSIESGRKWCDVDRPSFEYVEWLERKIIQK